LPSDLTYWSFFFTKINITVKSHPPFFSVSLIEDKTERPPLELIKKIVEGLGTVHMRGGGRPNARYDQLATPVPKFMNDSL
jgi:hypothetical protein